MPHLRLVALFLFTLAVVCFSHFNAVSSPSNTPLRAAEPHLPADKIAIAPHRMPLPQQNHNPGKLDLAPSAVPRVQIHYTPYSITGTTPAALRKQLSQRGPLDLAQNRRYDARTDWSVQWSFRYHQTGDRCRIQTASSSVDITMTLPQWQLPNNNAPQSLVDEWNQYLVALRLHEVGHQQHGIDAATEVLQRLNSFSSYASCSSLETAAQAAAQAIIQQFNQRDIAYDRTTRHGYTQGAVFPGVTAMTRASRSQVYPERPGNRALKYLRYTSARSHGRWLDPLFLVQECREIQSNACRRSRIQSNRNPLDFRDFHLEWHGLSLD